MTTVTISGAGAHGSAEATDRIPAGKAGVKGYLVNSQIKDYILATANTFTAAQTIASGTLTASAPGLIQTQAWNGGGVTFIGSEFNLTVTSSNGVGYFEVWRRGGTILAGINEFGSVRGANIALLSGGGVQGTEFTATKLQFTYDLIVTREAAATFRLGDVNAASPVSQTLSTQGSRGGTDSNVAGGSLTLQSGLGTGTGTPSVLTLKSPAAAASGTTQQTAVAGLVVNVGTAVLTSYTVAALPAASTAGAGATAFVTDAATTLILGLGLTVTGGGANKVPVFSDGTNWIYG